MHQFQQLRKDETETHDTQHLRNWPFKSFTWVQRLALICTSGSVIPVRKNGDAVWKTPSAPSTTSSKAPSCRSSALWRESLSLAPGSSSRWPTFSTFSASGKQSVTACNLQLDSKLDSGHEGEPSWSLLCYWAYVLLTVRLIRLQPTSETLRHSRPCVDIAICSCKMLSKTAERRIQMRRSRAAKSRDANQPGLRTVPLTV